MLKLRSYPHFVRRLIHSSSISNAKINNTSKGTHYILTSILQDLNDTGKAPITDSIFNNDKHTTNNFKNSAIEAANSFLDSLPNQNNDINLKDELNYTQLPDDSQFIEKHYNELKYYRDLFGKPFQSFNNATELFLELSKYRPEPIQLSNNNNNNNNNNNKPAKKNYRDVDLPDYNELPLVKYDKFIRDLKITLKLNGGHLFILDLLLQNKEIFDGFENKLKKVN
ncbi:hypothetical protein BVG19_g632 [[Candida] boidinii]|nr:hypothetical protein BVG19_g632 [[Candida] boidinii]OWB54075.1 hypothetical protein B5S27_g5704 [[Candida] boidinii]